ncbi:hypothetical protein NB721_001069 [Xanthomonas sacchari]|nr:hypothetical protein [Xanthomonas sacchari]
MQSTTHDYSQYSPKWQFRFNFYDTHGEPKSATFKEAMKALPFKDKLRLNTATPTTTATTANSDASWPQPHMAGEAACARWREASSRTRFAQVVPHAIAQWRHVLRDCRKVHALHNAKGPQKAALLHYIELEAWVGIEPAYADLQSAA